jgi:hypothetical protein
MITIDIETSMETVATCVVGHSSRGPIGTGRIDLGDLDSVVLKLTAEQTARLIGRLAERQARLEQSRES